jgi:cysteine synthase
MARHAGILDTVGCTPSVRLARLAPAGTAVYAKLEAFNPMGSVKDRLALGVIEAAEASGELRPGQTVIEATSGNTGIGLAMVCAAKGYPLVVVMAENFSIERRRLMRFLGAKVVLTPAALKGSGMLAKAEELAREHGWFLTRQFENPANADIHARTTAREILADFAGERLDAFVLGFGTGGSLLGIARVLKRERPQVRIVACEPENSALLGSGLAQPRDAHGRPTASHPRFQPHPMQGWSPDFISPLTQQAVDAGLVDEVLPVSGAEAMACARELARREGILTGISGGATAAVALRLAERLGAGAELLCLLPDTGERYLSTPLFEDIGADMDAEEWAISRATASARFDAPAAAPAAPIAVDPAPELAGEVAHAFARLLDDGEQPLLLFALEWCEFCWTLRKLFARNRVPYRCIDLDSAEWRQGERAQQLRALLLERTGQRTIPQVFLGGRHLGGASDVIAAWASGELAGALRAAGVAFEPEDGLDPYSLLPGWVQKRG